MSPEQALMFADPNSPAFVGGGFQLALGSADAREHIAEAFVTGTGFGWGEHDHDVFDGCRRFFEPGYRANIVQSWIPALEGVAGEAARRRPRGRHRLRPGRLVDHHRRGATRTRPSTAPTPTTARSPRRAAWPPRRGRRRPRDVLDRRRADALPAGGYDLVTTFDCLHDMGDPVGVARQRARRARARRRVDDRRAARRRHACEENLNPVGRAYYAFSTLLCTPSSLSQEVGLALGAQAGEARLREVLESAGFTSVRRAAETPFNLVLEARA